jgi:hypothetical protein
MAGIEPLISMEQLKMTLLANARANKQRLVVHYDNVSDTLILQIVPLDVETAVHYVDEQVALICQVEDLEIVGVQVEDFEQSFLPKHDNVLRVWRLGASDESLKDYGDMVLTASRMKPKIAREVVKSTEPLLGKPGKELAEAIA